MNKTMIFIALLFIFQPMLYAENKQQDNANTPEAEPKIITPVVGSQYNLHGMQMRDGQYKSSYSTKSVDDQELRSDLSSAPYGTNGQINPVVPVIIVTDE